MPRREGDQEQSLAERKAGERELIDLTSSAMGGEGGVKAKEMMHHRL